MADLEQIVYDSFYTYAGMVIADRAIVDVRDCLKPSPRVLLYNQYRNKNFNNSEYGIYRAKNWEEIYDIVNYINS